MLYREHRPAPCLKPYIRCYWTIETKTPPVTNSGQRLLAEGLEFTFNLAAPIEFVNGDGFVRTMLEAGITGPMTRPMRLRSTAPMNLFGICFRPGGGHPFFKTPANELVDQCPDVGDLWGAEGRRFVERIQNDCRTTKSRIETINIYLSNLLEKNSRDDTAISRAIEAIEHAKGRITIDQLARCLGISYRHLERKFKERVGITPKQLCRNMRFKHVYKNIETLLHINWADVALSSGYYDQAHLINEFKYFTGTSPAEYFETSSYDPDFFTANF
jgi:AraC-like DNA-binding protein